MFKAVTFYFAILSFYILIPFLLLWDGIKWVVTKIRKK